MADVKHIKGICCGYLNEHYPKFYEIYTDGFKDKDGIGTVFYEPNGITDVLFGIDTHLSIIYAKLVAISKALSYIYLLCGLW